jgi:hypothetical protein
MKKGGERFKKDIFKGKIKKEYFSYIIKLHRYLIKTKKETIIA